MKICSCISHGHVNESNLVIADTLLSFQIHGSKMCDSKVKLVLILLGEVPLDHRITQNHSQMLLILFAGRCQSKKCLVSGFCTN